MSKNDHSEKIYIQGLSWDGLKIYPDCPKINSEYKNFLSGHFLDFSFSLQFTRIYNQFHFSIWYWFQL